MMKKYFFCGIAGSGMSALAVALKLKGCEVFGSDRSFDNSLNLETKAKLEKIGIIITQQDGKIIDDSFDALVVSSAIEASIPDVKKALGIKLKIMKRAELLAKIFNQNSGIAIGGTSGKTTVTGMIGHILNQLGLNPFVINGGIINGIGEGLGNTIAGSGKMVIEADESDGSIELYNPLVAVVTNVSLDHKPLAELNVLFTDFVKKAQIGAVLNFDCEKTYALSRNAKKVISYSVKNPKANLFAKNIELKPFSSSFEVMGEKLELNLSGIHNVANALASIGACIMLDVKPKDAIKALASFKGIKRRLEIIGRTKDITVIDDFAHNPDKINASMKALTKMGRRVRIFFQMHGFAPTKLLGKEIANVFAQNMSPDDIVAIPEIYYAGGTADKSVSAKMIVDEIKALNKSAYFFQTRTEAKDFLLKNIAKNDVLVIMGARDDTLAELAKEMFLKLKEREQ